MRHISLRTKILLFVGLIIFVVLGTSTMIHIRDVTRDYLEALTWRSEALAQDMINEITGMQDLGLKNIRDMFPPLALRCLKLYESNRDKGLTHFAVVYPTGIIGPHNDDALWETPVDSLAIKQHLQSPSHVTFLEDEIYHTLVPVFDEPGNHLATIDIGTSKQVIDEKVQKLLSQSVVLFLVYVALAFVLISVLMHLVFTQPVRQLVTLGQHLADGRLVQVPPVAGRGDEVAILFRAFRRISNYVRQLADVAGSISTGDLRSHITPRSEDDVLSTAFQRMSAYLNRLATAATAIAGGDLNQDIVPESEHDVLGNAFHTMAVQLRENFQKIQQEVAERTHAQEALQQLNQELERRVEARTAELARESYILETFMNTVPEQIYFKDCEGRITRANKAYAQRFGFSDPERVIGKTTADLLPAELANLIREHEQRILQTGEPLLDRELPVPRHDGGVYWSLVTRMPLRDEHGRLIGTFGIARDITSQKQAQASLEQAYREILSLNRQLQEDSWRYYMKALLIGAPAAASPAGIRNAVQTTWNAPCFCVALLKLLPLRSETFQGRPPSDVIRHLMLLYDERKPNESDCSGMFSPIADTEAVLILNFSEARHVRELCARLAAESEAFLADQAAALVIGIGDTVNTPDDLHVSYDTAQQAVFARANSLSGQILVYGELGNQKKDALLYEFPAEKEQSLISAVIGGQTALVQDMLNEILERNMLEHSSYQKLMALYSHVLQVAGKILAQAPVQEAGSGEPPLLQTFRATPPETVAELRQRVDEVFRQLLALYMRTAEKQTDPLAGKILRYLERRCADPALSLDALADTFHLNPSYLSRYFKEQTGMNYVEYLALLRIKQAKTLLVAHPGHKIEDIGIRAGFSGKTTFIRTFKKFEGVTPGVYRKRALSYARV